MRLSATLVALLATHTALAAAPGLAGQASAGMSSAAASFKGYVLDSINHSLAATRALSARVDAKDLAGAQQAWLAARSGWERSEIVSGEYFPDLDRKIDAWPDADRGFHAIEAHLFGAHDMNVGAASGELVSNMESFKGQVSAAAFTPQGLLNGAAKLAYEIGEDKSAGGESPFSGNSLAEIRDNLACIDAAYSQVFAQSLKKHAAEFSARVEKHLRELKAVTSVASIQTLDQIELRGLSESLVNDFIAMAPPLGLERPRLGN